MNGNNHKNPGGKAGEDGINRRKAPRFPPSAIPFLRSVKLVAGPEVKLVNVSRTGALIESEARLSPGSALCLRLVTAESVYLLKGKIVRSRAAGLVGSVLYYQSAVAFDEAFTVLPAESKSKASAAAQPQAPQLTLQEPEALQIPNIPHTKAEPTELVTLTAPFLESDSELQEILGANNW